MIQQAMQKNPGEQTVDVPALMFQLRKEPELIESGEEDEEWEIPRRNLGCIRWHGEFHAPKTMGKHKRIFKLILPSGKHTKSYWKLPFIVDFPIKICDFP